MGKKNGYAHVVNPGPITEGTKFWYRQLGMTDGKMPVVVESSYETPGGEVWVYFVAEESCGRYAKGQHFSASWVSIGDFGICQIRSWRDWWIEPRE